MNKPFALAGELFGLLREEIKFGDMSMTAEDPASVTYRWRFKAGTEHHMCEQICHLIELDQYHNFLEVLAFQIVDKWKQYHRQASFKVEEEFINDSDYKAQRTPESAHDRGRPIVW